MFAHNFRVWRVYQIAQKLRMKPLKDSYVLSLCAMVASVDVVLLITWMALDPIQPVQVQLASIPDYQLYTLQCNPSTVFISLYFGYQIVLMLVGTYISIAVRKVQEEFNQSKDIGFAIYSYFFVLIIQILFTFIDSDYWTNLILTGLLVLFKVVVVIGSLFIPKLWILYLEAKHSRSSTETSTGNK